MPPANDNFADATVITGASGSTTGTTTGATLETDEPPFEHGDDTDPTTETIWYSWTAPGDGDYTFTLGGSDFDTVVEVYTGSDLTSLTLVGSDDDSGPGTTSLLVVTASTGVTYQIRVHGFSSFDTGTVALAWSGPPGGGGGSDGTALIEVWG